MARSTLPLLVVSLIAVSTASTDGGAPQPSAAAEVSQAARSSSVFAPVARGAGRSELRDFDSGLAPSFAPLASVVPDAEPSATASPEPTAQPTPEPTPVVGPSARPVPTAPPVVAAPASTEQLASCPSDWFCYPRVGIRGPIVPYTDCSGATDAGTAIRAFTCLSPRYLLGHAYTQMGRIVGWQQGDIVFAYGQAFMVTGAVTARSCDAPPLPLAPLSMQTSLGPQACGPVLIVQAR